MSYTDDELSDIYDKTEGYCHHCGKRLAWINYGVPGARAAWEVDHSNPLSRGGTNYYRNLVPSCIPCNRSKGALQSREFRDYLYPRTFTTRRTFGRSWF